MPTLIQMKENMKRVGQSFTNGLPHGRAIPEPNDGEERSVHQSSNRLHNNGKLNTSMNKFRVAIMQTQHQDHTPGAIKIVLHKSLLDEEEARRKIGEADGEKGGLFDADASASARISMRQGRRNSNSIGMIPQGLEVGRTGDGGVFGSLQTSIISTFRGGQGAVIPSAGGSPGGKPTKAKHTPPAIVQKSKTNLEIMTEQMQTGRNFHPPSKNVRKSIIDHFREDLDSFRLSKKSCVGFPIIHPASPGRMKWDVILAVVLVWNLIEIPFQVCFDVEPECASAYDFFALSLDVFFCCDVIVNFHTGFIDEGKYVEELKLVTRHYIWHGFFLDFITSIPYARVLNLFAGGFCTPELQEGEGGEQAQSLALLPRLLRIFRIFKLVKLFRLVKLMNVISTWEEEAGIGFSRFLRMVTLFFQMLFLSHIAGCLFAFIALDHKKSNDDLWPDEGWVYRYANETNDAQIETSKFRLYMVSFYWAITTLTTVGYGDILPFTTEEILLTVIVQFVGTLVFGYVMASITSVVSSEDMTAMLIKKKIGELNEYMAHRSLDQELRLRIRAHYEYQWKRTTIYDEEEILNSLPPFLRMDVACSMNLDLVKNVPVLAALGDDCMAMLVTKLKPLQLVPGETVVKKGTVGHEMYFITEGTLDVYIDIEDEYPKCSLEQGSYFGEPAILSSKPVKRSASIQARVFSQLESLSKQDFLQVAELFPDILKMLQEVQSLSGEDVEDPVKEDVLVKTTCENTKLILGELHSIMSRLDKLEGGKGSGGGDDGGDDDGGGDDGGDEKDS